MLQPVFEALQRRDAATALELARAEVAAQPDDADSVHALGLALHLAGDLEAAAVALDRAIALAPHNAGFQVARAALALALRDGGGALAALDRAVESDPNRLSAYLLGAHLALARGDRDEARRQLTLAQRVEPEHPMVMAAEGNLELLQGNRERALRLLSEASKALPDDMLVLSSLGLVHLAGGQFAFAEAALRRALEQQPQALRLRWALAEAISRQQRFDELAVELQHILEQQADDRRALMLLAECRLRLGDSAAADLHYQRVLGLRPLSPALLDGVLQALSAFGQRDLAVRLLELQLAVEPQLELLWQRRAALAARDPAELAEVLTRWRTAMPDSAAMHLTAAQAAEMAGRLDEALAEARAALAIQGDLTTPLLIQLRAALRDDPAQALRQAEVFLAAPTEGARRLGVYWSGLALDRLGRGDEAAERWRQASGFATGERGLPPIQPWPAVPAALPEGVPPRLLWGPPGSRVNEVVALLRSVPDLPVLDDRFGDGPRPDGLWPQRADGAITHSEGWRTMLRNRQLDPATVVDWLPLWDGRIEAALPSARLIAVIADPRDLFLNALVFGAALPWLPPSPLALAEWLAQSLQVLVDRLQHAAERTLLVRREEVESAPQDVAARLADFLQLPSLPNAAGIESLRHGVGGTPLCFPAGHWRSYRTGFAAEFAVLAPLAQRLGFSE